MKQVLLVVDTLNPPWAYCFIAEGLKKYAPDDVSVSIETQDELKRLSKRKQIRNFDAVLDCSWSEASFPFGANRYVTLLADHGCETQCRQSDWLVWKNVAGSLASNETTANERLSRFDAIIATNPMLAVTAEKHNDEARYLPAGVDTDIFKSRKKVSGHALVVGWCGKHNDDQRRPKGYHEILKPVMDRFPSTSVIEWMINGRGPSDALSRDAMIEWYNCLDLFLCTSICEGSPLTVFEAMACGVPVISTMVGEVGKASTYRKHPKSIMGCGSFNDQKSANRVIETIVNHLVQWTADKDSLQAAGEDARRVAEEHYSWKKLAPEWIKAILG